MSPISITKQLVADTGDMDKVSFAKHMTFRHLDSLGGLRYLSEDVDDYVESCYRSFHERLHATRIDLKHEHDKAA